MSVRKGQINERILFYPAYAANHRPISNRHLSPLVTLGIAEVTVMTVGLHTYLRLKMADRMDLDPPRGTKRKAEELDEANAARRIKVPSPLG